MSSSSITSTTSSLRISGMVSGIDTDSIVEKLMAAEKIPLNKLYQKKQLAEWKVDAYREITSALRAFHDKYFDVAKTSTNMFSPTAYKTFSTTTSDDSVVTVTGNSSAEAGSHTILVSNLATKAVYKSASGVTKDIAASSTADYSAAAGKDFVLSLDGEETTITLDSGITGIADLQSAIDDAVGSGKIEVSEDANGYLVIAGVADSGVGKITVSDGSDSALSSLGFSDSDNLSNRLSTSDTLEEIAEKMENAFVFDSDDNINLTINGVEFEFDKDTTLSEMMSEINSSDAGVTMKYNENSDTFIFTASKTGAGNKIVLSETDSNFLEMADVTDYKQGEDAVVTLDGEKLTRSSNSITVDGVTYKLLSESGEEQTVSLSFDTEALYKKIESFVSDYNSLIEVLNGKISEDYDSDYPPLTEDEKEEMSEDEIEIWEEKAKTGLLHNDSVIESLLSNMRSALYASVSGVSASLTSVGITTTSDYEEKGKLEIDSDALKEAIENNPDAVISLFSQQSESYSGTISVRSLSASERATRTAEEGLAYRIFDILQDNISTYRNSSGYKGLLLEKAGLDGDSSEYDNMLDDEIEDYEDKIDAMLDKLDEKEDYYYSKFSTMETYINNMNSQLSALQSYLSS